MTGTITRGASNVFADLGGPDAGERQTKTPGYGGQRDHYRSQAQALDQDVEINVRPHVSEGTSAVYAL